jgi:glutamyl-tRNA synthetase
MDGSVKTPSEPSGASVRGRLAPSPTGALHLGNARSFLLAWLSVRSRGGTLVLRMEDLDHPKVKPNAQAQALEDLAWLGLDWDEGPGRCGPHAPYRQSERVAHYREALDKLREQGLAYPCTCSRADVLAAQSAPHAEDHGPRYPGTCRGRHATYEDAQNALPEGRLPAWRFRTPEREVRFRDRFAGEQHDNVADSAGDFVLARHPDGAGYQLAVVVDDAAMGIDEVLRGDDLLPCTHWQILLYETLGLTPPAYVHVPLVVGPDGRRLAKRHGDSRIASLRAAGASREAVLGLLGHWCGWADPGEQLTPEDCLARYDLDLLPRKPVLLRREVLDGLA